MATVTWNVSKDATVATSPTSLGMGTDPFLPSGLYSGYTYRSLLGFSYSFSGMVAITSAVLWMKSSTQSNVAFGASPNTYASRITSSWSEGTSATLSGSNAVEWSNQPSVTTTNRVSFTSGTAQSTWDSVSITGMIQDAFAAGSFLGIRLGAVSEASGADVWEICARENSTANDAYIVVTYTTNVAPNAPTSPSPTADALIAGLTPTFSASFSDPDVGDLMAQAQVLVYNDDGVTLRWDSGAFAATGSSFSKVYAGGALAGNTFYKWQGRTADDDGLWGPYTAQQRFKINSAPNPPSVSISETPSNDIQTLTPTFNITHSDPDANDTQMTQYRLVVGDAAWAWIWDTGWLSFTGVTKSVLYAGPALAWQTSYNVAAMTQDSNGVQSTNWGGGPTFTMHTTGVPITLDPTGSEVVGSLTPTFTGSRAGAGDTLASAAIRVYAADGTTLIWDAGTFTVGVTTSAFSKVYAGTALSYGTAYTWQARVAGNIGGTSAYSALQSFVTPSAATPTQSAPVGSPITTLTPTFSGTWSDTLKGIHIIIYTNSAGTVVHWDQGDVVATVAASYSYVYAGTALAWNTQYWWKIRVQKNTDSVWQAYTGLTSFTTDSAGIPTLNAPLVGSWLGAPLVVDEYDDITGVTNGTSAAASLEIGSGLFQTGLGAMKVAITTLALSGTSFTYRTVAKDLTAYGTLTPLTIWSRVSSLTNISTMRLRFRFASDADFADFNIIPSVINTWEQKSFTKGSPTATGGTVNWANVTRIGVQIVATGVGSVTTNAYVDNLSFTAVSPSFNGTTAAAEVVSTFRIRVYAADQTTLVWDSGDTAGSSTTFAKLYAGSALVKGAQYYWQARYVKSTGPTGAYSALTAFTINADPSVPTGLIPATGGIVADSIVPRFTANFNDADKATQGDAPTYMEVEVLRNSDSVLAYTLLTKTGLISSSNEIYDGLAGVQKTTGAAAPLTYETTYKYRTRYYDSKGARGAWTSYATFKPSVSPTVVISSPANAGTVGSPSFSVAWSMVSSGGKPQNSYRVKMVRLTDATTIVDTGQVFSSAVSYVIPGGLMVNALQYAITVTLWDTDQMVTPLPDTNTITASWTAPAAIADFVVTDNIDLSANTMNWTASGLAPADFRKYVLYRKLSTASTWSILATITSQSVVYWADFTAADAKNYVYRITQYKIIPGDVDIESADSDIGSAILDTDQWFVVGADRSASHIFELPVIQAPFSEPVQQEVFEPLGTSRKVIIRGRVMGAEGSLQCHWDTSERDAALTRIDYLKNNAGPHLLKSPFGDVWNVEFSGPSKTYEGGGHLSVTLTWTEVV